MNDKDGRDYISDGGPEIVWHNDWGTAADYSVPASESYVDDAGSGCNNNDMGTGVGDEF